MSRRLHLMGVGGVGMCGLAEVLVAEGFTVSGCDVEHSERTRRLEALGVPVSLGHDPSHVTGVDALVVSAAVGLDHPEVTAARSLGLAVARRSELLGELMRPRRGVAVAGTHGKTTTTALVGHLLTGVGLDPTVLVGGFVRFIGGHARHGAGELFVCEADEFDRSFLELGPELAVITNVEPEHLDCYRDAEELQAAFAAYANRCAIGGAVIVSADDPGAVLVRRLVRRRVVSFGEAAEADLRAIEITSETSGSRFQVWHLDRRLGTVWLPLLGRHNVRNALAALAVGIELGLPFAELAEGCASFEGVARRFDVRGQRDGVTVVDDYAHHPTELRAVLAAAHQAMPGRRLVAVFQPHLFSRTRDFARGFAEALLDAEVAVVLPIYPAREQPIPGVSSRLVVDEALRLGHRHVMCGSELGEPRELLDRLVSPGDVVLTVGAGDVYRLGEEWLEART
jgi:UDP-N-acetylmuramate--alanine ligase